jgi:hypothetical protein
MPEEKIIHSRRFFTVKPLYVALTREAIPLAGTFGAPFFCLYCGVFLLRVGGLVVAARLRSAQPMENPCRPAGRSVTAFLNAPAKPWSFSIAHIGFCPDRLHRIGRPASAARGLASSNLTTRSRPVGRRDAFE